MHARTKKQVLLSIIALALVLGLVAFASRRPGLSVTILNPKFRLITARISHGTTHKLYLDGQVVGPLLELPHRAGLKFGAGPLLARTTNSSHALVARFIGGFTPGEKVWAEVVDGSGTITCCAPVQGYHLGASPHEHGMIWLLDSPLTNGVTIRLKPGIGRAPLAEIRIRGR